MARARTPADTWSLPVTFGQEVGPLVDTIEVRATPHAGRLVTDRSAEFVRWRYSACSSVASRAVPVGEGALVVRLRRRGSAAECTVGDVLGAVTARAAGSALKKALTASRADYAIASAHTAVGGMVRSSRLGPIQTRRAVSSDAYDQELALALGDVELF
jgi:hypothetical protein